MDSRLIKEISTGIWSLEPSSMMSLLPLAAKIRAGENVDFSAVVSMERPTGMVSKNDKVVAIIPVHSVIRKYDYCGEMGLLSMEKLIVNLDRDPSVEAIIFDMDSPGGSASYLSTFARTLRSVTKPTATYVNGTCASAAYHMAACTDNIFVSSNTDMVGSIGTMISFLARQKKEGDQYVEHVIYATKSTEKNKEFEDAIKGDYKLMRSNLLDPFNDAFHAHVMECRSGLDEKVLTGKIFMGESAQEVGLIDGMKTLDEVVEFVTDSKSTSLKEKISNRLRINKSKNAMAKNLTGISAKIGRELKAGAALTAEEIAMLNAEVAESDVEETEETEAVETEETEEVDAEETEETEVEETEETTEVEETTLQAAITSAMAPVMKSLKGIESRMSIVEGHLELSDAEETAEAGHKRPAGATQLDEWEDPNSEFNKKVAADRARIS